jgi:hypothetical protein
MYDTDRPWADDTLKDCNQNVERSDRAFWKELLKWEPPSVDILDASEGDNNRETDLDDLHKTIFEGHVDVSLPPKKNKICIMLASTFTDYVIERDLLLNDVLPYLQRFGAKFGINVDISELVSFYP